MHCEGEIMSFLQPVDAVVMFESGYLIGFVAVRSIFKNGWYLRLEGKNARDFQICTFRKQGEPRIFKTLDTLVVVAEEIGFKVNSMRFEIKQY